MKMDRNDVIFLIGFGCLISGIGMLSIPAALISAGIVLVLVSLAGLLFGGRKI
jgi:uncharacterized membrane-anchored protein YitT (DUF2179 family)